MRSTKLGRLRPEKGQAVAVEAAILIPALMLFVGLLIGLGRHALTVQAVGSAAAHAARAASIERSVAAADKAARNSLNAALGEAGINCLEKQIKLDTSGINAPLGSQAKVSVTVSCRVGFALAIPGFPASSVITQSRFSAVDTYRGK